MVKQGEKIVFDNKVDEVPFKVENLEEGKKYKANLYVCTKTSNCFTKPEGMELQTVSRAGKLARLPSCQVLL